MKDLSLHRHSCRILLRRLNSVQYHPSHLQLRLDKGILGLYVDPVPELYTGVLREWVDKANIESTRLVGYWVHKDGENIIMGQKPDEDERIVLFLHGGGYIHMTAHPSAMPSNIPRGIMEHCDTVRRYFAIEYRLTSIPPDPPQNPFPAALVDALAAYTYLIKDVGCDPSKVLIVGDSAGGNLAQALTRYLIEYSGTGIGLPAPPGGIVLLSPWVDMTASHASPDSSYFRFRSSDYIAAVKTPYQSNPPPNFVAPYAKDIIESPYISPASKRLVNVSFQGFPRTFICAGNAELFYDEILALQKLMTDELGEHWVTYFEGKDAFHDYLVFKRAEPERTETLRAISKWVVTL